MTRAAARHVKHAKARRAVLAAYQDVARCGLIVGSSGNVSQRTGDGMVITPSGGDPQTTKAGELSLCSLEGLALDDATPSSEWAMHAAIYRRHPDAGCIVHSHADACTALASLNKPLPAFHYMVVQFGGDEVRCAPYVTFGTPELADAAAEAIDGRSACLLANHGMIVHGRDAAQAVARAILLEQLCRQYLLALAAGKPRLLTADEMQAARERFKTYGPRPKAEKA